MQLPIGIFYEHPEWFKKLFSTLESYQLPYEKLHAGFHQFDPLQTTPKYSVVLNILCKGLHILFRRNWRSCYQWFKSHRNRNLKSIAIIIALSLRIEVSKVYRS
jgi:hypothetical protein